MSETPNTVNIAALTAANTKAWLPASLNRPVRNGVSTSHHESVATTTVIASATAFVRWFGRPSVWSKPKRWNISTGTCHKYSEYEISPRNTTGLNESTRLASGVPSSPVRIMSAAPRQGGKASGPGKRASGLYVKTQYRMAANPATDKAWRTRADSMRGNMFIANIVPTISSHARVTGR